MRRRWREGSSVLTLLVLVAATTANDSSLFECPKGSYRFTPRTDLSFPSAGLDRTIHQPSLLLPPLQYHSKILSLRCIKLPDDIAPLARCVAGAV